MLFIFTANFRLKLIIGIRYSRYAYSKKDPLNMLTKTFSWYVLHEIVFLITDTQTEETTMRTIVNSFFCNLDF